MNNFELESYLDTKLNATSIKDYSPNGLQVQGKDEIQVIVTGVTASQELIDFTISQQADAILVHHGYFWKGSDPRIRGYFHQRIKKLIKHDINLYQYHLPLDFHSELGNNVLLATEFGLDNVHYPTPDSSFIIGEFPNGKLASEFQAEIEAKLGRKILHLDKNCNAIIYKVGLCTGGGQGFQDAAYLAGCDAYITGEISEYNYHSSVEQSMHYFQIGHHASERCGVKNLGELLATELGLQVIFKDCYSPA